MKNFLFVLELSKSLVDITNLKRITFSGPDFFSCGLREALYLFIRLLMIISTPYYLNSFENTLCKHRCLNRLHSFNWLILLISVEVAHFLSRIENQLKVVFALQLVCHIKTKKKMCKILVYVSLVFRDNWIICPM